MSFWKLRKMRLVDAQQARQLDSLSEAAGVSTQQLMQNAGAAVAELMMGLSAPSEGAVVFFCGKGNNGGDGKVAAEILRKKKWEVVVIDEKSSAAALDASLKKSAWIVDGILGTGLKGQVRGWAREAIEIINRAGASNGGAGKKVLAIDIPSGLSADTGKPLGAAVRATVTACLGAAKLGCVLMPGQEYAGRIEVLDIGIPKKAFEKISPPYHLLEVADFRAALKPRPKEVSKKDFGHVLVLAGSKGMPGAGFLASKAALRSGCGVVTYCLPQNAYSKFEPEFAEVMVSGIGDGDCFSPSCVEPVLKLCERKAAVCLGPGLGRAPATIEFVQKILPEISAPLVLDADGIFALSKNLKILSQRKFPTILTPHSGEMGYLIGKKSEEVEADRIGAAKNFANAWNVILVLKGYRTLIAFSKKSDRPEGELYVNPTGNPGMATAGMGDVLAGVITGLAAQGLSPPTAALAGVYLHGLAGDMAREEFGEKGLIAGDVLGYVPRAIRLIEKIK